MRYLALLLNLILFLTLAQAQPHGGTANTVKQGTTPWASSVTALPDEGQQAMANSVSVAIASNQSAVPVSQSGTWDEVGINDSGNSITVDGTVTCNAGTNLNTSALALETSIDGIEALLTTIDADTGNIATSVANIDTDATTIIGHVDGIEGLIGTTNTNTGNSATSLAILDDWDETDRAKVNPIVGQAGVAAGSGTNGVTVQRVTIATDDEVNDDVDAIRVATEIIDNAISGSGVNISQINGVTPLMGAGATGTGSHRVTAASNSPEVTALEIMDDWDNAASDGASVSGDVAHDSPDAGEPVKIGGRGVSSEPSAVTANDRVNAYFDQNGYQRIKNHAAEAGCTVLADINTTYDASPTTATSAAVSTAGYRRCDFITEIDSANTPTDIQFFMEALSGGNDFIMSNGFLAKFMFEDVGTATLLPIHVTFPCPTTGSMQIRVVATGTDASNTFTLTNSALCPGS